MPAPLPPTIAKHAKARPQVRRPAQAEWVRPPSRSRPRRAGQLLGASQVLLPATDPMLRLVGPYDLPATVTAARAGGDPVAFDRGLAEGQAWTIDEAVAAGLASPADPDTGPE